ncbi:hypothetical protein P106B_84 [Rhizobium phage vB_RglS_P106B]|uniref:Uncharacterized protein n=1 Tax=Rhizobium phage vB_RglS_P106B TaxID=1458697 RepID=W6EC50_9CAUD|nr:hypothetical protein P106B_84 [Rhizobium phage vB_RglS_P106B]AHJ10767.1 hypothetical protein P106B_84 [Rhizobium phage vB_RglS_P106B]
MRTKLLREIKAELMRHNVNWEIANGTRHLKIRINGAIVGVISHNPQDRKDAKNVICNIRRYIQRIATT